MIMKFLKWLYKFEQTKIYPIFEGYFIVGTKKSYFLHTFLLWSNILLFTIAVAELFFHYHPLLEHYLHLVELSFGILFLLEFILKSIYIAMPNTIKGGSFMIVNAVVIASLIAPGLFGNLAILRIIRSLKIIKIWHFKKELKEEKEMIEDK